MNENSWAWKQQQNILPLVFDDSMSYYETVCKLVYVVNQLIGLINGDLSGSIKQYIDEQFNNIMITAIYDPETETILLEERNK
nr:MAG TPA: hypothetical protein [Caudoviricetes sp.]